MNHRTSETDSDETKGEGAKRRDTVISDHTTVYEVTDSSTTEVICIR